MNGRRPDLKVLFITGYAENAVLGKGHLEPGMSVKDEASRSGGGTNQDIDRAVRKPTNVFWPNRRLWLLRYSRAAAVKASARLVLMMSRGSFFSSSSTQF